MAQLKAGEVAPDFQALTDTGERVRLSDFRGCTVILYFYPRDDTSGCTTQACGFRDRYPDIQGKNAVVLGVSPDGEASHQKFRAKYDLPFHLLVDSGHEIAEKYGAWGERNMYGRKVMGIIRSQFVIDPQGTIRQAKYRVSPAKSAALALETLAEA